MRHPRYLIYKEHQSLFDYSEEEKAFIQTFVPILSAKFRANGSWTIDSVINEAFYETTSLLLDFSDQIYFENDYFKEAVKKMPISVANVVFSIVYITLREINKLENVQMMIENKLRTRPIFVALKRVEKKNIQLKFYPRTEYFRQSDFVDWKKYTEGFQIENIKHIMSLFPPEKEEKIVEKAKLSQATTPVYVARAIYGQAEASNTIGELSPESFDKVHQILNSYINNQLLLWINMDEVTDTGNAGLLPEGFILDLESFNSTHDYLLAKNEAESAKQEKSVLEQQLLKAQREKQEQLRETEEYKAALAEMKVGLGKSYIRLDTIADCILRLPIFELQYAAYQQINTLLIGTSWSEKAAEVLETMFAKVKEQQDRQEQKQDKMIEEVEKAANKKTNEFKVYPQAGSTANVGCQMQSPEFKVIPPSEEQQPALESRSATKGDACQSKNKEGDENV